MIKLSFNWRHLLVLLPAVALVVTGCSSMSSSDPGQYAAATTKQASATTHSQLDKGAYLHMGDTITITLSGPPNPIDPIEKVIKDDGTISLPYIDSIKAAGKTPGQLEDAIHDLYVPKYYTHLDVTVQASNNRVYYVLGEVKQPNRYVYTGEITVSRAIASAGDFTDFANKSVVYLTRANGKRLQLNLKRILAGKDPDPPVYPGDRIDVTRRIF